MTLVCNLRHLRYQIKMAFRVVLLCDAASLRMPRSLPIIEGTQYRQRAVTHRMFLDAVTVFESRL